MTSDTAATIRFHAVAPQFAVPDVVRTAEYYRDVLGFEILGYWDGEKASLTVDPAPVFGMVRRDAVQVFFSRGDQPDIARVRAEFANDAYFNVGGIDALAAEYRASGAEILDGPEDRIYLQRELVVRDCNGLMLTFAQDISGERREGEAGA